MGWSKPVRLFDIAIPPMSTGVEQAFRPLHLHMLNGSARVEQSFGPL
jgi:hypothetical protein